MSRVTAAGGFRSGAAAPVAATREHRRRHARAALVGTVIVGVPVRLERSSTACASARASPRGRARHPPRTAAILAVLADGRRIVARRLRPDEDGRRSAASRYRSLAAPALDDVPSVRFAVLSPQSRSMPRRELTQQAPARPARVARPRLVRRLPRGTLDRPHAPPPRRCSARRSRRPPRASASPCRAATSSRCSAVAFNEMADQLQPRLAELEAERGRLRDAITRFGDALARDPRFRPAPARDPRGGGRGHGRDRRRASSTTTARRRARRPRRGRRAARLPLTAGRDDFGTLMLVGASFDEEQRMTANSLAAHAAIALENARLHRIVERQALVDGLTGLANRRHCEDALTAEIARAERLRLAADARPRRPRRLQGRQRPTATPRRRRAPRVRRGPPRDRPRVRPRRPLGRGGVPAPAARAPTREGGAQLAERVREAFASASFLGRTGPPVTVTCSFGVAQYRTRRDARDSSLLPIVRSTRPSVTGKNRVEPTQRP